MWCPEGGNHKPANTRGVCVHVLRIEELVASWNCRLESGWMTPSNWSQLSESRNKAVGLKVEHQSLIIFATQEEMKVLKIDEISVLKGIYYRSLYIFL